MKKFSPVSDLAIEAAEKLTFDTAGTSGVQVIKEECILPDTSVTWVKITTDGGARAMGRPKGSYITIESPYMRTGDKDAHRRIAELLKKYLLKIKALDNAKSVLITGLGNRRITADSLGPKAAGRIRVTGHITDMLPAGTRSVYAVSPGVMGITGIETLEIIRGIVSRIKPDAVIAIDSLAARRTERINATIQLADTGVSPGAGVGNKRAGLDMDSLGVPVVAMGVPTVVDAATLVNDTLDMMLKRREDDPPCPEPLFEPLRRLSDEEKYDLIRNVLDPCENMIVAPKDVDETVDNLAYIIGTAVNAALNPTLDLEEL
ncbi:MAG: GPR endopeptidase [Firmicutes bacterium]|nr:GPR endopeptidase [Bacillota bacterium]